jgi:Ca2+-binding RTX toxin-like protein
MTNLSPVVKKTTIAKINNPQLYDLPSIDLGTFGTNGDDYFYSYGPATYYGLEGNDTITAGEIGKANFSGGDGDDYLRGSRGDDVLSGGADNDVIDGNAGNDLIKGGNGNDTLNGSRGEDELHGLSGNDVIDGGVENDKLWGEAGKDIFVFGKNMAFDTIMDYEDGWDRIDVSYYKLSAPPLVIDDGAGHALVVIDNNNKILVLGATPAQLTASDFIL